MRRTAPATALVAFAILAGGAGSCSKDLDKANKSLDKAQRSFDALEATCVQLRDPKSAHSFDREVATSANRSDQPISRTIAAAAKSRRKHCAKARNPHYQPYDDVSLDIVR